MGYLKEKQEQHLVRVEEAQEQLLAQIEEKRQEMIAIGMEKGFTAKETVQKSQALDKLLNEYERMNEAGKTQSK